MLIVCGGCNCFGIGIGNVVECGVVYGLWFMVYGMVMRDA